MMASNCRGLASPVGVATRIWVRLPVSSFLGLRWNPGERKYSLPVKLNGGFGLHETSTCQDHVILLQNFLNGIHGGMNPLHRQVDVNVSAVSNPLVDVVDDRPTIFQ